MRRLEKDLFKESFETRSNSIYYPSNESRSSDESWGAYGAEEVKEDGYRGEPLSLKQSYVLKTALNKLVSKSKNCIKVPTKNSCEVRTDGKPMDSLCELSKKNRCIFKKQKKSFSSKGGRKNKKVNTRKSRIK